MQTVCCSPQTWGRTLSRTLKAPRCLWMAWLCCTAVPQRECRWLRWDLLALQTSNIFSCVALRAAVICLVYSQHSSVFITEFYCSHLPHIKDPSALSLQPRSCRNPWMVWCLFPHNWTHVSSCMESSPGIDSLILSGNRKMRLESIGVLCRSLMLWAVMQRLSRQLCQYHTLCFQALEPFLWLTPRPVIHTYEKRAERAGTRALGLPSGLLLLYFYLIRKVWDAERA